MSSVVLTGDTSGSGTITVPSVAGTFTATIGSATGTHYPFTAVTAVASTSGTSIDFTGLPTWIKRITVMFNAVSTTGTSDIVLQVGSGSVTTTGYNARATWYNVGSTYTNGLVVTTAYAASSNLQYGQAILSLLGSNTWTYQSGMYNYGNSIAAFGAGMAPALGGAIDRIRITTTGGTDTFDAGSISILYE